MDYNTFKNKLLQRSDVKGAREKDQLSFAVAEMVMDGRAKKGITQKELALLVGTKQPSIARIEHGQTLPSLSFLERIAKALGTKLLPPIFEMLVEEVSINSAAQTSSEQVIVIREFLPESIYYQLTSNNSTKDLKTLAGSSREEKW